MHKLLYLSVPAHGHLNPALLVVRDLTQRGAQVIVYNTPEFEAPIAETGVSFRAYPQTELAADRIAQLLQDGNLAQISSLLLRPRCAELQRAASLHRGKTKSGVSGGVGSTIAKRSARPFT